MHTWSETRALLTWSFVSQGVGHAFFFMKIIQSFTQLIVDKPTKEVLADKKATTDRKAELLEQIETRLEMIRSMPDAWLSVRPKLSEKFMPEMPSTLEEEEQLEFLKREDKLLTILEDRNILMTKISLQAAEGAFITQRVEAAQQRFERLQKIKDLQLKVNALDYKMHCTGRQGNKLMAGLGHGMASSKVNFLHFFLSFIPPFHHECYNNSKPSVLFHFLGEWRCTPAQWKNCCSC